MRSRKRNQGATEQKAGAPLWMVTYGDMVTLVLCFFVLLYSFSSIDARKFDMAVMSLQGTFGVLKGARQDTVEQPEVIPSEMSDDEEDHAGDEDQLEDVRKALEEAIEDNHMVTLVSVSVEERGLVVRFAEGALFDLGSADLRPDAVAIMTAVGEILATMPNPIRVEGHTDNLPISTERFPSNWELSASRAATVVTFLIERHDMDPRQLSVAGYSEYRPIASNDTEHGRQRNRRVDVVIMHMLSGLEGDEEQARGD